MIELILCNVILFLFRSCNFQCDESCQEGNFLQVCIISVICCSLYVTFSLFIFKNVHRMIMLITYSSKYKTIIHTSLLEEMIDERKTVFQDFINSKKEHGANFDKDFSWILNENVMSETKSKIEKIIFDENHLINTYHLNAPDSNGNIHIIRNQIVLTVG